VTRRPGSEAIRPPEREARHEKDEIINAQEIL